jgi:hypothetical protein
MSAKRKRREFVSLVRSAAAWAACRKSVRNELAVTLLVYYCCCGGATASPTSIRRRIAPARDGKSGCCRRQSSIRSIISTSKRISKRSDFLAIDVSVS